MRYDEFRDQLQDAFQQTGLIIGIECPSETVGLASMDRAWEVHVWRGESKGTEPFDISAKISFNWTAVNAARAYTCEEDVLTEMLGRRVRVPKTQRRWVRVDFELYASLPFGSAARIPDSQILSSWSTAVSEKLDKVLTEIQERQGQIVAVTGGRGDVKFTIECKGQGEISINEINVSAFRLVRVPRVWDDPDRRNSEKGNSEELARLAQRFKIALEEWINSIAELGNWIRYSPPPPEAKPLEPWFEDEEEEGGPETIH